MAIKRSQRFLGSQRIDVPHLRSIESGVRNDFDELFKALVLDKSYVIRGFNIIPNIGGSATGLNLVVANAAAIHVDSKTSGSVLVIPPTEPNQILNPVINKKIKGNFVPNAVNYIGIELKRKVDTTSLDTVYFWNPSTKNETSMSVPVAEVLTYEIVITTSLWAPNVLPIAKISVDAANNVLEMTDQRPLLYRLGTAGFNPPDPANVYDWAQGQNENPSTSNTNAIDPFYGGDKAIKSLKDWADAVMSEIKSIKGTTYWYSPNIGGSLTGIRFDLGNTVVTGRGSISHHATINGRLNWSDDIYLSVIGSRLRYQILANPTSSDITIANNQVAYINLVRDVSIAPNLVATNGSPVVQSVGNTAWTTGLMAGDWIKLASDNDTKYIQIQSVDSLSQVTLTENWPYASTGVSGTKFTYAFGVYQTAPTPSTNRHIWIANKKDVPFNDDVFWLFLREDNTGSTPRIYIRFLGTEIEQGETRQVSDNQTSNILDFIGSTGEIDTTPIYSNKINGPLVTQEYSISCPAGSAITTGQYFRIYSAWDDRGYYVWFNVNGGGGNPFVLGHIPIQVNISSGDTASMVATALANALNTSPFSDFSASASGSTVLVVLSQEGEATDAVNFDVGGLTITKTVDGVGYVNKYITDTENLALSIKRLDKALYELAGRDPNVYEEIFVVTSPIAANTNILLPVDTRRANEVQTFTVGSGELEVYLNGQKLYLGNDYIEIGAPNTQSRTIQTLQALVVGDELMVRIDPTRSGLFGGGGGGGGGEANTGANVGSGTGQVFKNKTGVTLNFRTLQAGPGITISQSTNEITLSSVPAAPVYNVVTVTGSNYSVTASDDYVLVDCAGSDRNINLPSAIGLSGKRIVIKLISSGNNMNIFTALSQTIDGINRTFTPLVINVQYESITVFSDGANWWVE
jgi:hypothetical protein